MSCDPEESAARQGRFGLGRRELGLAVAPALATLLLARIARAATMQVPVHVQAGLIAKLAGFDRNFAARAGDKARVLLVVMPGDSDSAHATMEMKSALGQLARIGELPHEEEVTQYTTASALAELVRARRAAIVYFGPGFGKQLTAIRDAFSTVNVLTVGAIPEYVGAGVVLGFDLISGRPKLLIHLVQARKQQVIFPASVLNLMKVQP